MSGLPVVMCADGRAYGKGPVGQGQIPMVVVVEPLNVTRLKRATVIIAPDRIPREVRVNVGHIQTGNVVSRIHHADQAYRYGPGEAVLVYWQRYFQ